MAGIGHQGRVVNDNFDIFSPFAEEKIAATAKEKGEWSNELAFCGITSVVSCRSITARGSSTMG
jgi:hypothetical protein